MIDLPFAVGSGSMCPMDDLNIDFDAIANDWRKEAIASGMPILVRRLREQREYLCVQTLTATVASTTGEIEIIAAADGTVVATFGESSMDLTHLAVGDEAAAEIRTAAQQG